MAALLLLKSHVFHLFTLGETEGAQARACMQSQRTAWGISYFLMPGGSQGLVAAALTQ